MRKLSILTLFVAAGLLAADKPLAPFVRKALTSAVYGEKSAAARYDAFAAKAEQEGYERPPCSGPARRRSASIWPASRRR